MKKAKRIPEYRAESLKTLTEQRAALYSEMNALVEKSKAETRAFTEEESTSFSEIEVKIKALDATIEAEKRAALLATKPKRESSPALPVNDDTNSEGDEKTAEERAEKIKNEEKAFVSYIKGNAAEIRAGEIQLTQGNNGGIVPTSIADKIICKVKEIVPFLELSDTTYTNGKLSVPVYNEDDTNHVSADYVDEGVDLVDNVGKFTTIDLTGYVIGSLALVSNKLITNTDVDVVSFIVNKTAEAMTEKLEEEFIGGKDKITGILAAAKGITTASAAAITYNDLLHLKHSIKKRFRKNAVWIMNDETYTALCELKDGNGQPYFKDDDYTILNCKVSSI